MVSVSEAGNIIQAEVRHYGTEQVYFEQAMGRTLAEDLLADRDLPPCNRVTMDGIAIRFAAFEKGVRSFAISSIIAAGDVPTDITDDHACVEIMTGAALPLSTDTVVRYEDVNIDNGIATIISSDINKGQNLHLKGRDKKKGDTVARAGQIIGPELLSMAASIGKHTLLVCKSPRICIITTGDELTDVTDQPTPYQVRRSNNYTVKAVLRQYALNADMMHIPDDLEQTRTLLQRCREQYDVILMSGGVSMGKFDYVPRALTELEIGCLFHKVQQRPGKPFWFGKHRSGTLVFAFPGNPVSTFLCLHRYFIPWLLSCTSGPEYAREHDAFQPRAYAQLGADVAFAAPIQYYMQVRTGISRSGILTASPAEGNGSGDFANLLESDAFMELPAGKNNYYKGEVYPLWPFKRIV